MQEVDEDFQLILSKQDYEQLKESKGRVQLLEKQLKQQKELTDSFKKACAIKKEEIVFLSDLINKFIQEAYHEKEREEPALVTCSISQSTYQILSEVHEKGFSSIEMLQLKTHFTKEYTHFIQSLSHMSQWLVPLREQNHQKKLLEAKENEEMGYIQVQLEACIKAKRMLQERVQAQSKELKENKEVIKQLTNKLEEYKIKLNMDKKNSQLSYFIKLLIDEYYVDLEKNMAAIKLEPIERKAVIVNEMAGIKEYINILISKIK